MVSLISLKLLMKVLKIQRNSYVCIQLYFLCMEDKSPKVPSSFGIIISVWLFYFMFFLLTKLQPESKAPPEFCAGS